MRSGLDEPAAVQIDAQGAPGAMKVAVLRAAGNRTAPREVPFCARRERSSRSRSERPRWRTRRSPLSMARAAEHPAAGVLHGGERDVAGTGVQGQHV
jgi:hypothetical protein